MSLTKPCDWCPDDTCDAYWRVVVFRKLYRICNCCYTHLRKETSQERELIHKSHKNLLKKEK